MRSEQTATVSASARDWGSMRAPAAGSDCGCPAAADLAERSPPASSWRLIVESDDMTINRREPWNKGIIVGQKAPFKPKEIWAIRVRLQMDQRTRELALFNLGIDSKLRACDLTSL